MKYVARFWSLVIFSALFFSAFPDESQAGYLPPNDLHLRMLPMGESNVTKKDTEMVIAKTFEVFEPIFEAHGAKLIIKNLWDEDRVNATAQQSGKLWIVSMYGGLARAPEVTVDGFAMVLCHEIGHHLGGFPFSRSGWAANEGQSDYFAAQVCMRKVWKGHFYKGEVDPHAREACSNAYKTRVDRDVCYRSMMGGYSLGQLLSAMRETFVDWDLRDRSEVDSTILYHPKPQCRFDTYRAAALCKVNFDLTRIPQTEAHNARESCVRVLADTYGLKPRCWFAPTLILEDDH